MIAVSYTYLLAFALVVIIGVTVGRWAFKKDTKVENRRRAAAQLATVLSSYGLVRIPAFLMDYAVGDYSGMAERIRDWVKLFTEGGQEAVIKEFDQVFDRVLSVKLMNAESRAYIRSLLDQHETE